MKNEYVSLLSSSPSSRLNVLSSTHANNSVSNTSMGKCRYIPTSASLSVQSQQKPLSSIDSTSIPSLKNNRSSSLPLKIMFKQQQQHSRHSNAIPVTHTQNHSDKHIAKSWNGNSNSPTFHSRISSTSKTNNAKLNSTPFFTNGNFLSYKHAQLSLSEHFINLIEQQQQQHYNEMKELKLKQQNYKETSANKLLAAQTQNDEILAVVASSLSSSYSSSSSSSSSPNDNDNNDDDDIVKHIFKNDDVDNKASPIVEILKVEIDESQREESNVKNESKIVENLLEKAPIEDANENVKLTNSDE